MQHRALLSVSDKTGIVAFGTALVAHGYELLSTGGTARVLREGGLSVTDVSEATAFPEMMDGRVKTLHPMIHGGLLGREGIDDAVMAKHGIGRIDVVAVNLYPFEATVAREDVTVDAAVEQIDIGGPSMVRSAAKNHRRVTVLVDPLDYDAVAAELASETGVTQALRSMLAAKAFLVTARYDAAIASYLADHSVDTTDAAGGQGNAQQAPPKNESALPSVWGRPLFRTASLRYGENPHQSAGLYTDGTATGLATAVQTQGKALSYNNWIDADAAFRLAADLGPDGVAIFKHTNPCGAARSSDSLASAYELARACDPVSYFGGIVGTRGIVDADLARVLVESFLEVIVCAGVDSDAAAILSRKKNLRVLTVDGQAWAMAAVSELMPHAVSGGMLIQQSDSLVQDIRSCRVVTMRQPTDAEWEAMVFGWRVAKHVKSNAIVFAQSDRTVGIGAGQMSRVDSSRIAVAKSRGWDVPDFERLSLDGSAVASDAFFPFADGVLAAADAGATAVVQPGGSIRDAEVIAAADSRDLAMVFTGHRHFRH